MFGENLKAIIVQKKISSRKLAAAVGLSQTYISYLLNNKKNPSLETVQNIAAYLEVSPNDLMQKTKEPPPQDALGALARKYEPLLLALDSMKPELVAELTQRIEAAASLFPRMDAPTKRQDGASSGRKRKPG